MSDNERYTMALEYATQKHSGQYRIGGEEYITHPVAVAEIVRNKGYGTDYQITALFHDLLEDTDATERELRANGANDEIVEAVRLLTKHDDCAMRDYVGAIRHNNMAFVVKNADRLHNLRSAFCTSEEFKRQYITETREWYLDFSDEIREAVSLLSAKTKA